VKLASTKDSQLNLVRAIVYGDTGVGKTTSLGTLPEDKTLICVGERGLVPLRKRKYAVLAFSMWDDLRTILSHFLHPDEIEEKDTQAAVKKSRIVAIDSLSEISDLCMQQIVGVDRKALIQERTDKKTDKPPNIYEDLMGKEDWNLYRSRMLNLISAFCHLPVHVIFTCRANWPNDKNGNPAMRTPGLSGKAANECGAHVGLLLHMEAAKVNGKDVRRWQTFKSDLILAKDESGALEPFEEADWMTVFAKIIGTRKQGTK
jgi:hypothetical protein